MSSKALKTPTSAQWRCLEYIRVHGVSGPHGARGVLRRCVEEGWVDVVGKPPRCKSRLTAAGRRAHKRAMCPRGDRGECEVCEQEALRAQRTREIKDPEIEALAKRMWHRYINAQPVGVRTQYSRWDDLKDEETLRGFRALAWMVLT